MSQCLNPECLSINPDNFQFCQKCGDKLLDDVPLVSARGIDYTKLRDLLTVGKWKEADEETECCMLKVARRESEGWLRIEDIDNFSCEDLRIIDQLWVKYSNGKFGFSVQKQIYQSVGGTTEYDSQIWEAFCNQVGWRQLGKWLYWDDLTFSLDTHCTGHLPVGMRPQWVRDYGMKSFLVQRFVVCCLLMGKNIDYPRQVCTKCLGYETIANLQKD